jgi:RNA polymerase sigma-70 factor (ECF subfamily)
MTGNKIPLFPHYLHGKSTDAGEAMADTERNLVGRFQHGEAGAFEQLFASYGDRVYRLCYRLCGHPADAEDLAQEVFVAAYQGLDRFAGRSSLTTWLYRIACFRWGQLRGRRPQDSVPLDAELDGAVTAPDPAPGHIERLALEEALNRLPEPLREAFVLVKGEGLKYREAAQVLGIPQGTVQSRVHDAVARLRALLTVGEAGEAGTQKRAGCRCSGSGRGKGGKADHAV